MVFDLRGLPAGARITAALLKFPVAEQFGAPFIDLGCLQFEALEVSLPFTEASYDAEAFFISCESGPPVALDLLIDVAASLEFGLSHLQLRMGFEGESDGDGVQDGYLLTAVPVLEVTYNLP